MQLHRPPRRQHQTEQSIQVPGNQVKIKDLIRPGNLPNGRERHPPSQTHARALED
jgi:hypothetical protein